MAHSDYMENNVCAMCLLVEVTEELGLYDGGEYEEVDNARQSGDG